MTPLGQACPRHGCTTLADSRHSTGSCFTSPNFNLPGYPAIGLGSLTPSVPSIASSHHVSSTWPPSLFTSRPSTLQLTIDQANSIFSLASECQALSIKLVKEFHVLSGLEAMHHNSIQGTAHDTLTLRHSAQEATYLAILWDDITETEHEATTHRLHSEADAAWKEMHEVMYNHQLNYDQQLTTFLKEAETTLNNMRDQVWVAVHNLAENEGITFVSDCKYSTCSRRSLWTSRSRHRYLSPLPTAQSLLFTEDGALNKVGFPHFIRKSRHLKLCPRY